MSLIICCGVKHGSNIFKRKYVFESIWLCEGLPPQTDTPDGEKCIRIQAV